MYLRILSAALLGTALCGAPSARAAERLKDQVLIHEFYEDWSTLCTQDPISDSISCDVSSLPVTFKLASEKPGVVLLGINRGFVVGKTTITIRIDKNKLHRLEQTQTDAYLVAPPDLVEEMRKGDAVAAAYWSATEQPPAHVMERTSLKGLREALDVAHAKIELAPKNP